MIKDFHLIFLINYWFSLSSFITFHIPHWMLFNYVPFFLKEKRKKKNFASLVTKFIFIIEHSFDTLPPSLIDWHSTKSDAFFT